MRAVPWIAVPLMLVSAVMLVADVGASALWIAAITLGIAMITIERMHAEKTVHR